MSQRPERARFAVKPAQKPAGSLDLILIGRLVLAAVLLVLGAFVVKNEIISIILLVLSAVASAYDLALEKKPQIIAANKCDAIVEDPEVQDPVERIRSAFEPEGVKVYAISGVSGQGIRELLYAVNDLLKTVPKETFVFEQEYFPEQHIPGNNLPFEVWKDEKDPHLFHVEGPKVEKMLGYTNLDSEKGFQFFQNFLKDTGILKKLENLGIEDGDTVKLYELQFDYYR